MPPFVSSSLRFALIAAFAAALAAAPGASQDAAAPEAPSAEPSAAEREEFQLIQGLLADGIDVTAAERIQAFIDAYPGSERTPALTRRLGELRLRMDRPDAAADAFRAYLAGDPAPDDALQARYLLATSEEAAGHPDVARGLFREVIDDDATPDELRLQSQVRLAELSMGAGDHAEAAATLEEVTRQLEEPGLLLQLGDAYFELRQLKDARSTYRRILDEGFVLPEEDELGMLANLALVHFHFKDYEKALEILEPLHERTPDEFRTSATLAWTYYELERYAEAYDRMKAVAPADPQAELRALLLRARQAKIERRFEDAEADLRQVAERGADAALVADAYHELAGIALAEGDVARGIRELLAFASSSPDPREASAARLQAAELQRERQLDPEASAETLIALLADPDAAWMTDRVLRQLAESQIAAGDGATAISTLTDLVADHPASPERARAYLLLGEAEERIGDLDNAESAFTTVVRQHPDSPWREEAMFRAGLVQMKLHRWDLAAGTFAAFLDAYPESRRGLAATLDLGHAVLRAGDAEAARAAFEAAGRLASAPDVAQEAAFFEGRALEALDESERALERYRQVAGADPPGPLAQEAAFRAGLMLRALDRGDEAIAVLEKLAAEAPDGVYAPWALWESAAIHVEMERPDEAVATLTRLREAHPEEESARTAQDRMEMILLTRSRIREALESMPAFTHNNPASFVRAGEMLDRARDLSDDGQSRKASDATRELLDRYPGSLEAATVSMELGREAYGDEDYAAARRHLQQVLRSPEAGELRVDALFLLGNLEFTEGRYRQAADRYRDCLGENPPPGRQARAHYLLGSSLYRLGEISPALDEFVRFRETLTDPSDLVDEQIQVGIWLQEGGRLADATRAFESLVEVARGSELQTEVQYYLAETLEMSEDLERALVEYLKVVYAQTGETDWNVTARFRAGQIYESRGQFREAIKLYQGIADSRAGSEQGEFAARKVRELQGGGDAPN